MENLNGHEAGNGGNSQGDTCRFRCFLIYSDPQIIAGQRFLCGFEKENTAKKTGRSCESGYLPFVVQWGISWRGLPYTFSFFVCLFSFTVCCVFFFAFGFCLLFSLLMLSSLSRFTKFVLHTYCMLRGRLQLKRCTNTFYVRFPLIHHQKNKKNSLALQ